MYLKIINIKNAREIIGNEEFEDLRKEVMDAIGSSVDPLYNVEEIMLDYGLEMDYIFDVIGYQ